MKPRCKNCGSPLESFPEREAGDWIVRCFACGANNVIEAVLQIVGWRP